MKQVGLDDKTVNTIDCGSGPTLLFVHGFPLDHTMWLSQIEHFASDYRVVAPDLPGFGNSGFDPQNAPTTYSMKSFADDLLRLLDALDIDEPVVFCGLSMGGYIGWQFVRHYNERVKAMILCDTKSAADTKEVARARHFMADGVIEAGTSLATKGMLDRMISPKTVQNSPDVAMTLQAMIDNAPPHGVAAAQRGMAERPDVANLLPHIDLPTLLICGEGDQISPPAEMQSIAAAIPNATFATIPNAGHMPPMEQPEEFNLAVAEFLNDVFSK
ncbi:MAG: alpha/beta hydrolase [Planctomycetales bacterium]|nr:alpha/beta hydrolase [Planctomycetales bacterium]